MARFNLFESEGLCFVFDAQSGQTHLLNEDCALVFQAILDGPQGLDDLARSLKAAEGWDDSLDELKADLGPYLEELGNLGLITSVLA